MPQRYLPFHLTHKGSEAERVPNKKGAGGGEGTPLQEAEHPGGHQGDTLLSQKPVSNLPAGQGADEARKTVPSP